MLQLGVLAKRVRAAKRIGPVCVASACFFIFSGTACFLDVIAPGLPFPYISIPICFLILLNLCMHYYYAVTVSPGFLDEAPRYFQNGSRKPNFKLDKAKKTMERGASLNSGWSERGVKITSASLTECKKCKKVRPERAHHCSACNKCVIKYDHHCPVRINQCVGLHNERHFILFTFYVAIATIVMVKTGFKRFILALIHYLQKWNYNIPPNWFVHAYMLFVIVFLAATTFFFIILHGVVYGETALESQDNQDHRAEAKFRNQEFINSYNCGKWKNLQLFFNITAFLTSPPTLFTELQM